MNRREQSKPKPKQKPKRKHGKPLHFLPTEQHRELIEDFPKGDKAPEC